MKERTISRRDFMKLAGTGLLTAYIPAPDLSAGLEANREYSDVLNTQTQAVLAAKAKALVRPTHEGTVQLVNWINNTEYLDGSNVCGSLAAYQLINTVTNGVRPEDLWLADVRLFNPAARIDPFSRAFPDDRFDAFDIKTPIATFDFNRVQLQPGDFMYFRDKDGGYPHMMAAGWRDSDGVIWGVTNYPNENKEYVIDAVPLWNPKDPDSSFMKELAKGANSKKFSSGQGGVVIFRLKKGEPSANDLLEHSRGAEALRISIENAVRSAKGNWDLLVTDLDSGKVVAENSSNDRRISASVIKVPVAACVMSVLESKVTSSAELSRYLKNEKYKGATFDESLTEMLVDSSEQAAARMGEYLDSQGVNEKALLTSWGIKDTNPSMGRVSTEQDMYRLFKNIYNHNDPKILRFPFSHQYLLDLMSTHENGGGLRLGQLEATVKGIKYYNKIGSIAGSQSVVADSGIIETPPTGLLFPTRRRYFISLNGQPKPKSADATYSVLDNEFKEIVGLIGQYLKGVK